MATARKKKDESTIEDIELDELELEDARQDSDIKDVVSVSDSKKEQERLSPEEIFLQNQEQDSYTIAVYRLPSNHGRTDSRGGRVYCGQMGFVEYYEDEIKERFGSGEYVLELRKSGKFVGRKTLFIEGEDIEETEAPATQANPNQNFRPIVVQQPQVQDSSEQFRQFLRMMKEAKELAEIQKEAQTVQTPVGSLKDLKDNLQELKDVAEMFNGGGNKSNSTWENIAMTLLAGALPVAQNLAAKYLTDTPGQNPTQQPQAVVNADGSLTLPNGQVVRPATNPAEQVRHDNVISNDVAMSDDAEEISFLDEPTEMLIDELVKEMCDPKHQDGLKQDAVERAAELVKNFKADNPLKALFIDAIIAQDPEEVLKQLAGLYQPEVSQIFYQLGWTLDFIGALKAELQKQ